MASSAEDKPQALVAHNVYFTLHDGSAEAVQKMVAACHKYLAGHEGTVFYAAGPLAADFDRPVNDRDFHVGLHVVFKDKAAHDKTRTLPTLRLAPCLPGGPVITPTSTPPSELPTTGTSA